MCNTIKTHDQLIYMYTYNKEILANKPFIEIKAVFNRDGGLTQEEGEE